MRCSEIMGVCRKPAPEGYACDWDNPDLLAGRGDKEVRKIYIAPDATDEVVEAAIASEVDILSTHHPLIFRTVKKVNDQNFITKRLMRLIQADISYYVMHTNFDAAPGCIADLATKRLDLSGHVPLETLGEIDSPEGTVSYGIGKGGVLRKEVAVKELTTHVKDAFDLPLTLVCGDEPMGQRVSRISVCPGAGGSEIEGALAWGAQVPVAGDISHHQGIDVAARGVAIIGGGHYRLERILISYMAELLRKSLGDWVGLEQTPPQWPAVIVWQENRVPENEGGKWNGTG